MIALVSSIQKYRQEMGFLQDRHFARRNQKEKMGTKLSAPFMTLSFMALLVIPHVKLSDKGLFNGDTFSFEA